MQSFAFNYINVSSSFQGVRQKYCFLNASIKLGTNNKIDESPNKLICVTYIIHYKTILSTQLCSYICLLIVIHLGWMKRFFKGILLLSWLFIEALYITLLINPCEILGANYGESLTIIPLLSDFIRMMVKRKSWIDILEISSNCKSETWNGSLK